MKKGIISVWITIFLRMSKLSNSLCEIKAKDSAAYNISCMTFTSLYTDICIYIYTN